MRILIAKQNLEIVKSVIKVKKEVPSSSNTIILEVSYKAFIKLRDHLRSEGFNPYSFMTW